VEKKVAIVDVVETHLNVPVALLLIVFAVVQKMCVDVAQNVIRIVAHVNVMVILQNVYAVLNVVQRTANVDVLEIQRIVNAVILNVEN